METREDEHRIRHIVRTTLTEVLVRLSRQLEHLVPDAGGANVVANALVGDVLTTVPQAEQWLRLARYGAGMSDEHPDTILHIAHDVADILFGFPKETHDRLPATWAAHPFGALWWCAVARAKGDDLIPIAEAARLAGVSVQAISQRIDRGTLSAVIYPLAKGRRYRRLVRKRDVVVGTKYVLADRTEGRD